MMRVGTLSLALCLSAAAAYGAEVSDLAYGDGKLTFLVKGDGAVALVAQIDFTYISEKTGVESLARATSATLKADLTGTPVPVTIAMTPPAGVLSKAEVVIFADGDEVAREEFAF